MGDMPLVRRTAQERKVIHSIAPHLCEPRWMVYPVTSRRSLATMRVGVTTYEKLGSVGKDDIHRVWNRRELAEHEPSVASRFPYAIVFREYVTDDARLVLANLRAAVGKGAVVLNYLTAVAVTGDPQADGVVARCGLTGADVRVAARGIVNAAGPWVDAFRTIEDAGTPTRLQLSRGIHVVVPRDRLPVTNMVALSTADKRSIFAIAQGDGVYVGTTDTAEPDGPTRWPRVTRADVEYLLDAVESTFSVPPLGREDVVAAWAGLRPLVAEPGKSPAEISRKDEIWIGPRGVVTVAGGKLTGYRPMAIDVVDAVDASLGLSLSPSPEPDTLPGGHIDGELTTWSRELEAHHLDARTSRRLAQLYGSEATEVLGLGAEPLVPGTPILTGELRWAVEVEGALTLEDVFYRRLRAAWFVGDCLDLLEPLARALAPLVGWEQDRISSEVAATRAVFADELAFQRL